jgi:hypothetical protein
VATTFFCNYARNGWSIKKFANTIARHQALLGAMAFQIAVIAADGKMVRSGSTIAAKLPVYRSCQRRLYSRQIANV